MIKRAISYVISFVIVILLLIIIFTQIINSNILNKNYIKKQADKSDYYQELSEDINEKFRNHIMQSGMEEVIFDGIFTEYTLKTDFEKVLNALFNGEEIELDTTEIREKLNNNIEKYALDNNINITIQNREQINIFEDVIIQNYTSSIKYSDYAIKYFSEAIPTIKNKVNIILETSIILAIILIVVLFVLNRNEKIKFLSYIGISLIAVGGLLLIALIYEKINLNLENSIIIDKTLSKLLKIIVTKIINKAYIISGFSITIGILFSLGGNITKIRKFR